MPASLPQRNPNELVLYEHPGKPLAILPQAIGEPVIPGRTQQAAEAGVGCAVVRICGPLAHEANWMCDGYDAIRARVGAALASDAPAVVLWIDSPGGEVAGTFDCARDIQKAAKAAGKKLISFTEGRMCSAAYALACAASEIVAADTAEVGSVGTIVDLVDVSEGLEKQGIKHRLVKSGDRKADSSPLQPKTQAAINAVQERVDDMAGVFFEWVAANRPLSTAGVEALQADYFVGARAKANGLVDRIASWSELCAELSSPGIRKLPEDMTLPNATAKAESDKDEKKDMRALLAKAEEDEKDPKAKARIAKARAAYESDDEPDKDKEEKDKKDAAAIGAAVTAAVAPLAAHITKLESDLAAAKAPPPAPALSEAEQRAAVLATRTDLSAAVVASLAGVPTASLAAVVAAFPKASFTPVPEAAALGRTPPVGAGGALPGFESDAHLPPDQLAALNAVHDPRGPKVYGVVDSPNVQRFGVEVPK